MLYNQLLYMVSTSIDSLSDKEALPWMFSRYLSAWFFWSGIYDVHDSEDFKLSQLSTKIILILPPIILDVLNIFWSFKIVNGLINLFKPKTA